MELYYRIADELIVVRGTKNNKYFEHLCNYFSDKRVERPDGNVCMKINVFEENMNNEHFTPDVYSLSGKISFNHTSYQIKGSQYTYIVKNLFEKKEVTNVTIIPKNNNYLRLKRTASVFVGPVVASYNKFEKFVTNITSYECLWYLLAITLMKYNKIFVHSGMAAKNGKGMILTGTSGCGKTSGMMELITNEEYKYVSEDFGILSGDGIIYDMQKKSCIYQSDVKWGNMYLKNAYHGLPLFLKSQWKLKSLIGLNPAHYFKPIEIFGNNISKESELSSVFILQRVPRDDKVSCTAISKEEMAKRMMTAAFREIKELFEILTNIRAAGGGDYFNSYPDICELEKEYVLIALSAINNANCYQLSIPMGLAPSTITNELLKRI